MKKNISINISGIIFHIEEDGYETLRNYLDSINRYFSSYDDSKEIISDIENRIAEIFLSKLTNGKQIITAEDVDSLMATMGSIQDFEAIEEPETIHKERSKAHSGDKTAPKKLYRDNKRRILGGVASGLAHYFSIDPLWIRLILVIGVLGLDIFLWGAASGFFLIGYIVLWIVVPGSESLEEDKEVKKLFRNPEDRVIAGVASGIGAYFGTEVTIIRLLFVITFFFGGAGLLIYLILWIIAPEAKSITDKMQMQGESVTLSNIETNIKRSLNVEEGEEENLFVKILLFPFRLIATLVSGLGKALGPFLMFLVEAIRVIAGIILVIVAVAILFGLLISSGALLGIFTGGDYVLGDLPLNLMRDSIPVFTTIAAFFALFMPALALALLGVTVIAKRKLLPSAVGWSMFAIWMISLLALGLTLPGVVREYRSEGIHKETQYFELENKQAVLKLREVGMDEYEATTLRLYGYEGDNYKLIKKFESRGSSRLEAIQNAQMVTYSVQQQDSLLIFDSNIMFAEEAKFRGQTLEMELYIPYDQEFFMDENLKHIIRNTIYSSGYRPSQMDGNTWIFTESGLRCTTCEQYSDEGDEEYYYSDEFSKEFEVGEFNSISVGDDFIVNIRFGEEHRVYMSGEEIYIQEVSVNNDGGRLEIGFDQDKFKIKKKNRGIEIDIETPELQEVLFSGTAKAYINGFELSDLRLQGSGVSVAEAEVDVAESLDIELQGGSSLILRGSGKNLMVDMDGGSELDAFNYQADNVEIDARGASHAGIYASSSLNASSAGSTEILYQGNPEQLNLDEKTGSSIAEY